ncbi:MAG: histidine--tRNA ligase, partial [Acetanaerobacterium sp.]
CYLSNCFRYEKPQAGRWREFTQFGVEVFGPDAPDADAEVIALASEIITTLGGTDLTLKLNSIGCPDCRAEYHKALKAYFESNVQDLCETCRGRLDKNPMRILDCKSPVCGEIAKGAPRVLDYICGDCRDHFDGVKTRLTGAGIAFTIDPTLVRGLDYYTNTVFEFVSNTIGAQGTVCGGGRYNGLVEALGGSHTPALGFGMGLGRLLLVMENGGAACPEEKSCDIYFAPLGDKARQKAFELNKLLRAEGFFAETDLMGRSLKAQMKYADKLGASYTIVIGDNELMEGVGKLKNMNTGEQTDVPLSEDLLQTIYNKTLAEAVEDLNETQLNGFDLNSLK